MDGQEGIQSYEVPEYSQITAIEESIFVWNIPEEFRTTALPADRTGSDPETFTDFDDKFTKIKETLESDDEYTNTVQSLWDKYGGTDDNTPD